MDRLLWTLGIVAVCVLLGFALLRGWRSRAARQSGIGPLPAVPVDPGPELADPLPGVYVSTTSAGSWQDRVVVHGLGRRARVDVRLTADGILLDRVGESAIFVPIDDIREVTTAPGIAGKVMALPEGVLVITWTLAGTPLDSGIRSDDPAAQARFLVAARSVLAARARPPSADHERERPTDSSSNSGVQT